MPSKIWGVGITGPVPAGIWDLGVTDPVPSGIWGVGITNPVLSRIWGLGITDPMPSGLWGHRLPALRALGSSLGFAAWFCDGLSAFRGFPWVLCPSEATQPQGAAIPAAGVGDGALTDVLGGKEWSRLGFSLCFCRQSALLWLVGDPVQVFSARSDFLIPGLRGEGGAGNSCCRDFPSGSSPSSWKSKIFQNRSC